MTPAELIQGYVENSLSQAEADALRTWLAQNPAHVDDFVLQTFLDRQLCEMLGERALRENVLAAALATSPSSTAAPTVTKAPAQPAPVSSPVLGFLGGLTGLGSGSPILRLALWGVATLLGTAVLLLAGVWMFGNRTAARVTAAVNCRWADPAAAPGKDGRLTTGQTVELTGGVAEITFNKGAHVLLEAPATLKIKTDNSVYLQAGKVVAKVPKEAVGFTVLTSWAEVVDLGTEFAVQSDADGQGEAHVFSGRVLLETLPAPAQPGKPATQPVKPTKLDLRQGEAVSVAANRQIKRIAAQRQEFEVRLA